MAVHDGNTILVRHFPSLKSRQIARWEANKAVIQAKYGIPHEGKDGFYHVWIVDFGNGYRTEPDENLLFSTDEVFVLTTSRQRIGVLIESPFLTLGGVGITGLNMSRINVIVNG